MKKLLILLVILCFTFTGCNTNTPTHITEAQALSIASDFWKTNSGDVDSETGFMYNIRIASTPTEESNNYEVVLSWLVDNHHYSVVDTILIDASTGNISYPTK